MDKTPCEQCPVLAICRVKPLVDCIKVNEYLWIYKWETKVRPNGFIEGESLVAELHDNRIAPMLKILNKHYHRVLHKGTSQLIRLPTFKTTDKGIIYEPAM